MGKTKKTEEVVDQAEVEIDVEGEDIDSESVDMESPFTDGPTIDPNIDDINTRTIARGKFARGSNFFDDVAADQKKIDEARAENEKLECLLGKSKLKALTAFGYKVIKNDSVVQA